MQFRKEASLLLCHSLRQDEIFRKDDIRRLQGDAAFDDVFQLTDIPRKRVLHQQLQGIGGYRLDLLSEFP